MRMRIDIDAPFPTIEVETAVAHRVQHIEDLSQDHLWILQWWLYSVLIVGDIEIQFNSIHHSKSHYLLYEISKGDLFKRTCLTNDGTLSCRNYC